MFSWRSILVNAQHTLLPAAAGAMSAADTPQLSASTVLADTTAHGAAVSMTMKTTATMATTTTATVGG